jgi:hypothetical protein
MILAGPDQDARIQSAPVAALLLGTVRGLFGRFSRPLGGIERPLGRFPRLTSRVGIDAGSIRRPARLG